MPGVQPNPRTPGFTLIELCVLVAILAFTAALCLPVLQGVRERSAEAACLSNLKTLSTAALAYSEDNKGYFFYHWGSTYSPNRERNRHDLLGYWTDQRRLGAYLENPEYVKVGVIGGKENNLREVVGGPLVCPGSTLPSQRSYSMNIWASGIDLEGTERARSSLGRVFRAGDAQAARLILFAESFTLTKIYGSWMSDRVVGDRDTPGKRFGGNAQTVPRTGHVIPAPFGWDPSWIVDYSRHSAHRKPLTPNGNVNFGLSDGSALNIESDVLYSERTGRSRLNYLWSTIDGGLE